MHSHKPILLLEDDQVDAMTVKRALKEIKVVNQLIIVNNGEEGLDYLKNENNERPCIILLDLNMPKMNGLEFLKVIKQDSVFKSIPVIVLTTSNEDQDRIESFNHSVAGYILKPVEYVNFVEATRVLDVYWTLSELPE